jgi:hypothetical protein
MCVEIANRGIELTIGCDQFFGEVALSANKE